MADPTKGFFVFVFTFFVLFSLKDVFVSQSTAEVTNKDIPLTNLGSTKYVGHTLKIMYCYSCGYRNMYEQYYKMLAEKYPDVIVEGGNYPPSGINAWLARILTITKMLLIFGIVTNLNIGAWFFNRPSPSWWTWCLNNKIYACIMIFLTCNMFEGQLVSTGAFEITFNDVPVWSKLETGRIPEPPTLFQIIDNHLRFQSQEKTLNVNPALNY